MPTKGQMHDVFLDRTGELADRAAAKAAAARGAGRRPWAAPEGWSGDPRDIPGLTAAYDRGEIDRNYAQLIGSGSDPGTTGDVVAVKTQSDYTALQERGLRTRYASSIRCAAHATARWRGHGAEQGVFGEMVKYVQDAIKAGGG